MKKKNSHFSIKCVVSLSLRLIDLLEKLHQIGYIHCDIKPENIMIGDYKNDKK